MANRGGARIGAGRPRLCEELKTADLAREALINKFGGLNEALIAILEKDNPILTKFVLEHAFGKSPDKLEMSGGLAINWEEVKTYHAPKPETDPSN